MSEWTSDRKKWSKNHHHSTLRVSRVSCNGKVEVPGIREGGGMLAMALLILVAMALVVVALVVVVPNANTLVGLGQL